MAQNRRLWSPRAAHAGRRAAGRIALLILLPAVWLHPPPAHAEGPLGPDDCVRLALQGNPDLAVAQQRILAAGEEIRMAEAAYYPKVTLGGTYSTTNNPAGAFTMILNQRQLDLTQDFNNPETTGNYNTRLALSWSLYDGGRRGRQRSAAQAAESVQRAQASSVRNDMIYQVYRGFYGILQAGELVKIQEASVGSLERSLETAKRRFAAGAVVKTDVLNLEVSLAEARETLARAKNREALARSALANLAGNPELRDAEFENGPPAAAADPDSGELTPEMRPELRAARADVERLEAEAARARGAWRPSVNLVSQLDLDWDRFQDRQDSWMAGVSVQWDVFEGSRRGADIRRAGFEVEGARERERRVRLALEHELQEATLAFEEARERVAVTEKSVDLARESLRITRERYENGAVDITELLAAEVALTEARALAATALYDREIARAGIGRATGRFAAVEAGA